MPQASAAIVEGFYAAALGHGAWATSLEPVAEFIRADHIILRAGTPPFLATARVDPGEVLLTLSAASELAYDGPALERVRDGGAVTRSHLMADRSYARTSHYNETVRPLGGFHAIFGKGTSLAAGLGLAVCRGPSRSDFGRDEIRVVSALMPHLSMAIDVCGRISGVAAGAAALEAVFQRIGDGVIVCDRARRPLFVNERAQRLLDEGDGLGVGVTGLFGASPEDTRRLRCGIDEAERSGAGRVRLSRRSGRPPLLLRIVSTGMLGLGAPGQSSTAILIAEPDSVAPVDREAIAEAYGLTRREAEVAALLAGGASPATIAAGLGIETISVRIYLKRVFNKTEARTQAALVALLRGFV